MDAAGNAYVGGYSWSNNFPTTANAYQSAIKDTDGFIAVIDPAQSGAASLIYATFFGGSNFEEIDAVAVKNGLIYFAGSTASGDLPLAWPGGCAGGEV